MKKTRLIFLTLSIAAIACIWTASPIGGYPTDTPPGFIGDDEPGSGAVWWPLTPERAQARELCAVVVADEALHLRAGPSVEDIVLTWLRRGDVVRLISKLDSNWSRVRFEGFEGWARGSYLEEVECE